MGLTRFSFVASTAWPGNRACLLDRRRISQAGQFALSHIAGRSLLGLAQLAGMSDRSGGVGRRDRSCGCVGHATQGACAASSSLCDACGCASIAGLRRGLSFPFHRCRQHRGGGVLPGVLSQIKLDRLAACGGHWHFARLHRGPLPDGCDGWMGGGRIDRGGRGLVRWSRFRPRAERMAPAGVRQPSAGSIS